MTVPHIRPTPRGPRGEGQHPWSQIQKLRPEGARPGLPCPAKAGWGRPRPQLANHLLTCFLPGPQGGKAVGTGHVSASQPPGRPPPGRPGHRAQVSRTAGSSASSRPRRCGARGRVTPQGPQARTVGRWGWLSGRGRARPTLTPSRASLRGLGRLGVSTVTSPQPLPRTPGPAPQASSAAPILLWLRGAGPAWSLPAQASG